jgi:hypothetical protein
MSSNPFRLLGTDSDSEEKEEVVVKEQVVPMTPAPNPPQPTSPPFRVWKLTPEEEKARAVFNSPFTHRGRKPRIKYEKDKEGWVSIKKNQPNFNGDSSDSEKEIKKEYEVELETHTPPDFSLSESAPTFSSLLSRGVNTPEQMTAHAWAEKVKQSLEKAEQARKPTAMTSNSNENFAEALGKLSFFRSSLTK